MLLVAVFIGKDQFIAHLGQGAAGSRLAAGKFKAVSRLIGADGPALDQKICVKIGAAVQIAIGEIVFRQADRVCRVMGSTISWERSAT